MRLINKIFEYSSTGSNLKSVILLQNVDYDTIAECNSSLLEDNSLTRQQEEIERECLSLLEDMSYRDRELAVGII